MLKRQEFEHLTTNQLQALTEIIDQDIATVIAMRIMEKLA